MFLKPKKKKEIIYIKLEINLSLCNRKKKNVLL